MISYRTLYRIIGQFRKIQTSIKALENMINVKIVFLWNGDNLRRTTYLLKHCRIANLEMTQFCYTGFNFDFYFFFVH